jgi:riboflavin synthase
MFTGIVEELGRVVESKRAALRVETELSSLRVGDSVAVNGVCLTVARIHAHKKGHQLDFELSLETLARTSLGLLRENDEVNLERPLSLHSFIGGHLMTGHVDASVLILSKKSEGDGDGFTLRFELPRQLRPFVPLKGSVAVDGVSLTVTKVGKFYFEAALVPHTLKVTTLGRKGERELVHLEVDLLARYLRQLVEVR